MISIARPVISGTISLDIPVPAETLWDTATADNAAMMLSHVVSAEILTRGRPDGVGEVTREVRVLQNGRTMEMYKTITAISKNPYSVSVNIHTSRRSISGGKDAIRVGTWTILPIDEKSCTFVWSFTSSPNRLWDSFWTMLCRKRVVDRTSAYFLEELEEYAAEAVRRKEEQNAMQPQ